MSVTVLTVELHCFLVMCIAAGERSQHWAWSRTSREWGRKEGKTGKSTSCIDI